MHFDDRLATVLRQPAKSKVIARIQYRQLLDLLGKGRGRPSAAQLQAAYARLAELATSVPAAERAAMLREPMVCLRDPQLVALLAEDEPVVATAAIASADLDEEEWLQLIPALPIRARGILRHRRGLTRRIEALLERLGIGDRVLPHDRGGWAAEAAGGAEPFEDTPAAGQGGAIGALVRRIEQFRKSRDSAVSQAPAADAPRLPLEGGQGGPSSPRATAIDFVTDAEGRIVWAEAGAAPMMAGLRLASRDRDGPAQCSETMATAFRRRQPIRAELMAISGAPRIRGEWQVDAAPRFDHLTGRFTGYGGRLRRPAPAAPECAGDAGAASETDRMRQILHELRTPANAIQMSAEVIQQALHGPAPHEYRALAATIASDTAHILAGFDELERLIKLEGRALELEPGVTDLAEVVSATVARLRAHTDPRKSGYALEMRDSHLPVGLDHAELQRLVWRLLAALAGAAAPSEVLEVDCRGGDGFALLRIALPKALAGLDDEALFHARAERQPQALSAGMFGLGFTLRLAAAEAKAAGGGLERERDALKLALPGLTERQADHSQG